MRCQSGPFSPLATVSSGLAEFVSCWPAAPLWDQLEDAETLIIYALSQFHPEEHAYDRLIAKVVTLGEERQTRFALPSASVLSAHLRWGFWLMYGRDVVRMRDDNVGDYPWLLYSVLVLLRAWSALLDVEGSEEERRQIAGSLLLGLAADPWADTADPSHLDAHKGVRRRVRSTEVDEEVLATQVKACVLIHEIRGFAWVDRRLTVNDHVVRQSHVVLIAGVDREHDARVAL